MCYIQGVRSISDRTKNWFLTTYIKIYAKSRVVLERWWCVLSYSTMIWVKSLEIKKFFACWKKNPKFDCLIFGNWSNLPPGKEQSPTWISCKTHECSNHQLGNMKKQPPTMPNFFFWFLANKLFYCRYHHKCSNHQPECDFKKES